MGFATFFDIDTVALLWSKTLKVAFVGHVENGLYVINFSEQPTKTATCLMAKVDVGWLWHRRLAHVNMRSLQSLLKGDHVRGLTNVSFAKDRTCSACIEGKLHEKAHPPTTIIYSKRPLELLHMDLFRPPSFVSLGARKYCLVIVDDYSRYTWVYFFKRKSETQQTIIDFANEAQHQHNAKILTIRSDNGTEFKNYTLDEFLSDEGIKHQYSTPYTPQQNGVAERKNRTLMDATRTMMAEFKSPYNFWAEAINTACHASNRLYLRKGLNKTPYEILTGNKPNLKYFRVFGCKCFILKKGVRLSKFEARAHEGIFVGYATNSHAYRVLNKSTGLIEETCNMEFDENNGSQVEQSGTCDVGDEIPPQAIRIMGVGHILPIEEPLVSEGEGQCSTQVEPSPTQDPHASEEQGEGPQPNEQDQGQDQPQDGGEPPSDARGLARGHEQAQDQEQAQDDAQDDQAKQNIYVDVHWIYMNHMREDKHRAYFGEALDLVEQFGIEDVISFHLDFDPEIVAQFFASVHFHTDEERKMTWITNGQQMTAKWKNFMDLLHVPDEGLNTPVGVRPHSNPESASKNKQYLVEKKLPNDKKTWVLNPFLDIMHWIFRNSLFPRIGIRTRCMPILWI
ncbi:uncharacterized protein [Aegilops tauschii subsp. strangulata]|uniref:uncharacterized protein n=1 Tax=Aegilops tauschii subsp. strangulata TaxID=200361 RepID=UPI003CC867D1